MALPRALGVFVVVAVVAWVAIDRIGPWLATGPDGDAAVRPTAALAPPVREDGGSAPGVGHSGDGEPAAAAATMARFGTLLDAAVEQARVLVRLGQTRSRNLLAIAAERGRMEARLAEIDALLARGELPPVAAPAVAAYRDGAAAIRAAMAEAEAGFLRLDWGRVGEAVARLEEGTVALARARDLVTEVVE